MLLISCSEEMLYITELSQSQSNIFKLSLSNRGLSIQCENLQVTTFCIGSPQRVFWAQECVVGAQVEVFTGQPAVILIFDGRQNLKQKFSFLQIIPTDQ